jgi:CRP-like cAMP-binding protein
MDNIYELLKDTYPFNKCSPEQIQQLVDICDESIHFKSGEFVFHEGESPNAIYIVAQGTVEVLKKDEESGRYHQLRVLKRGASLGEMALIDAAPRSADVRALDDVTLLVLPLKKLEKISSSQLDITSQLKINLCKVVADRLRSSSENVIKGLEAHLEETKARAALGYLTTYMFILTGIFMLLLGAISKIASGLSSTTVVIGMPILILYTLAMVRIIHQSGYPLSNYGLTTKNWRVALKESFWATLVAALVTVLFKWYLVTMTEVMANEPIFDLSASFTVTPGGFVTTVILYGLLAPIQEFLTRGGFQGALQMLLTGSPIHRVWKAIFIANLMFSALHVYISINIAALVFPIGLLWGWLYSRHGTIIGISLSHIFLGMFAFYVVGFIPILR